MTARRRSPALAGSAFLGAAFLGTALLGTALLGAALLVAGCGSRDGARREAVFRQVTAPVAFEMMHDFPGLPVLDLRPAADFHGPSGHIRGAFNAPFEHLPELLRDIAYLKEETFLIYCQAEECAPLALDWLHDQGFENAMMIHGGIEAWIEAGFGTVGAGGLPSHSDDEADDSGSRRVF